ncbi:MGMT family protein [Geofilum rubicundum]|uniref:Methylated-DNA-[protein]-cysteine S-methyltransferase n=1 Tax=Geofilum rubicundum JCM 15548 TaxID=1236989 RepID=A0A0E9LQX4_9BACT|nr:MGMT family protein [Geofilum rubicundum]GAO27972.1 methylated-DNA-[protein]-cysteine S-methyltransferase [Geofilum rubicundum JCM 15548]
MTRKHPPTSTSDDFSFFERVYAVTRLIPYGRVTSYGAIAAYIGSPGAARMVGWALNKCHTLQEFVPAHRVVNRIGVLSGKHFFPGENTMKELLEAEGLNVQDNQLLDFDRHFWNPASELSQTDI